MATETRLFILVGNREKVYVGDATVHENEIPFGNPPDTVELTIETPLYLEHPERGDIEVIEKVRFIGTCR